MSYEGAEIDFYGRGGLRGAKAISGGNIQIILFFKPGT